MPHTALPLLFSFRRCPYAIRARLALGAAGIAVSTTEVVLRDKPPELRRYSPKATVPVLVLPDGRVIDESLDIMRWALQCHDPCLWLQPQSHSLEAAMALIADMDGQFKPLLDRCKYPERHPDSTPEQSRSLALQWLARLERRLAHSSELSGGRTGIADAAIFPFVRQFAAIDPAWWQARPLPHLQAWHARWLQKPLFISVMARPAARP